MEKWPVRLRKKWLYRPRKSGFLGYGKSGFKGHGKVALLATYKSMSEEATLLRHFFYQCGADYTVPHP